eukprot:TRINITY_DN26471_c0_g1_i1.p1 TRINITY_DN26471_c0_g1~~TRINITY_DN26471_c0_g1_i1.p1  ORF type:complete len:552 (+),score=63.43 TRINITY_DN26471_c0_g1_i1:98-1753(+)
MAIAHRQLRRVADVSALVALCVFRTDAIVEGQLFDRLNVSGVGTLRGLAEFGEGVSLFAGIRFAEAPVGNLRWRPPQPVRKHAFDDNVEVDATQFGSACPQVVGDSVIGEEDCLTLNVYTPSAKVRRGNSSLPVLVWLHGGSFVGGTADIGLNGTWGPLYDGRGLAARGSVVVTIQFRLGIFGHLGAQRLRQRDPLGSTGNYGLQDQQLAMKWVQDHIASFGGNPARVLLFGQSSGACSVELHMVSPYSAGLFAAVAMSSGAGQNWCYQDMESASSQFRSVLHQMKCTDVECLVHKPVGHLLAANMWATPVIDGVFLKREPLESVKLGNFTSVPAIVGFVRDDGASTSLRPKMTESDFDALLVRKRIPAASRPIVKHYYSAAHSEWYSMALAFSTEHGMSCPMSRFAHAIADAGGKVYAFKFSQQPSFPVELMYGSSAAKLPQQRWGAYHGADLPFIFGNSKIPAFDVSITPAESILSEKVGAHYLSLAATGAPLSSWPALPLSHDSAQAKWLLLDAADVAADEIFVIPHCELFKWDSRQAGTSEPAFVTI